MRVLVAGGSGVLGRAVIPRLLTLGHEVSATSRSTEKLGALEQLGATGVVLDARDRDATAAAVRRAAPEAILHLMTDLGTGDSASNALLRSEGTRNLVDAARAAGVRRIIGQSISWIHPPSALPAIETDPLDLDAPEPRRSTVHAVQALEAAVHDLPQSVVLRFGQLYGAGTWYSRAGRFAEAARSGALPATETVTSFVHVDDAAAAVVEALGWPTGVWNIVDDEPAPGTEWAPVFAHAVGAPAPTVERTGDVGRPVSNDRARAQGFTLRHPSWRAGFATL
ncbi:MULTISPECIES: NAD(P)-dependent oxidoreductase [unclassified Plantibacter]|uniref:NAD-dependent epimerase/dehydratase family protein n=1 Tax=unclassified Plantibacter TaxID=2624265 RepID=UPI0006FC51DD|nr:MULTISPECIES: NAD(P)-dependent oxidoreductase [unclassified Plantibacter]KQQ51296.1 dTDP-glucose 4,6-dehydratase [Plantibacter sp. Leaf314]